MAQSTAPEAGGPSRQPVVERDPVDTVRLIAITILIGLGWAAITIAVVWDPSPGGPANGLDVQGLSPAIRACYLVHTKCSPVIIAVAVGVCIGIAYIFGTFLYKKFRETSTNERYMFWKATSDNISRNPDAELRALMGAFREYEGLILDKRNIYWSLFTRVTLAILVVGLIALLISTCKIESQAGLPIISGIIGFIIGQSAELVHSAVSPTIHVTDRPPSKDKPNGEQNAATNSRSTADTSSPG